MKHVLWPAAFGCLCLMVIGLAVTGTDQKLELLECRVEQFVLKKNTRITVETLQRWESIETNLARIIKEMKK